MGWNSQPPTVQIVDLAFLLASMLPMVLEPEAHKSPIPLVHLDAFETFAGTPWFWRHFGPVAVHLIDSPFSSNQHNVHPWCNFSHSI